MAAAVVAIVAIGYFAFRDGKVAPGKPSAAKPSAIALKNGQGPEAALAIAKSLIADHKTPAKTKKRIHIAKISYSDREDLSAEDKRRLTAIQDALEKEDLPALIALLPEVAKSANDEVREEMVDALGWFGERAMLELLPFMADRNEDVAQSAMDNWTTALADVENQREKVALLESAMHVIRDEDGLESMIMELGDCDDVLAMQTIINLISSPNAKASRVAREHYEFVTGEPYVDVATAEQWVRENCELDGNGVDESRLDDNPESLNDAIVGESNKLLAEEEAAAAEEGDLDSSPTPLPQGAGEPLGQ
ncbi:MAG: hypothetical protein ACI4R9_04390 [Kiritimatiellia bacterium]